MTMQSLIERLEAASGPDRDLDAEIAVALGHKIKMAMTNYTMDMFPAIEWQSPHPYAGMKEPCPVWTSSIDAALTLVPEGWSWKLLHEPKHTGVYRVAIRDASTLAEVAPAYVISSPTPALALCIAAFKARCLVPSPVGKGDA